MIHSSGKKTIKAASGDGKGGTFVGQLMLSGKYPQGDLPPNTIELVHHQFRTLTKAKGVFSNENNLLNLLYLGLMNAREKGAMPIQNWNLTS
ncbi:hypothetical protein [Pectobacterium sp. B2J-2]|uniref:hypothetical protein n=1 Tax=Pectobacterium sp. B2J-2 TaxID=3385372 RepID=UPI0038FCF7B5